MRQPHIIKLVLKFNYVTKYQVGDKVEIPVAETLLANYNDFYTANSEFYQGRMKAAGVLENQAITEPEPNEEIDPQVEKRLNDDVKAFTQTWGSLDFASATLVGLDIDWDSLQDQLLAEQNANVSPVHSKLIPVAAQLRKVASVLAFSERIVARLRGKAVDKAMVDLIIQGFTVLLQQVHDREIDIPELNGVELKKINKLKTVDAIIDYANQLFALGR